MTPLHTCEYCGEEINPNSPDIWILITGWVQPRKKTYPQYPTAPHGWACQSCMTERKYGTPPDSLF